MKIWKRHCILNHSELWCTVCEKNQQPSNYIMFKKGFPATAAINGYKNVQ